MYTEKPLVTINCCESSSAHNRVTYAEGAAVAPGPVAKNIHSLPQNQSHGVRRRGTVYKANGAFKAAS